MKYLIIVISILAMISQAEAAQYGQKNMARKGPPQALKELGLTSEQMAALKEIRQASQKELKAIRNAQKEEVQKILSPEQMVKFTEMIEKRHGKKGRERRGPQRNNN